MNSTREFREWLESLTARHRRRTLLAGAAAIAVAAFLATVAGVFAASRFAFSDLSLTLARLATVLAIGFAAAFALAAPLIKSTRRGIAKKIEERDPQFNERVITLAEDSDANPFHEIVAAEALQTASQWPPERFVPGLTMAWLGAACVTALGLLGWVITSGPGALGHGASLLWAGVPPQGQAFYRIEVTPGDSKVRKGSDMVVEARLVGFLSQQVKLMVRPAGKPEWETLPMEPKTGVPGAYGFLLVSLAGDTEYRVEAGRLASSTYRISVLDLPAVNRIRVTYFPPAWLGLARQIEDPGGDLRAVAGTEVLLEIESSRPLLSGAVILDDGRRIRLTPSGGNTSTARLTLQRDGVYHIAALDGGQAVRISDDYFIEARAEKAPEIKIARPGRDAKVSPIEEVVVEVDASDDYGLNAMELRYSVNGGEERVVDLLKGKRDKQASGRTLISLEDFKLEPGDILALHAVAKDARNTSQTDIYFIEAQPFEKEYSQSQQSGGAGGGQGGGQQEDISRRQKEVIAATWNQLRSRKNSQALAEDAAFLSSVQRKLSAQTRSLSTRMQNRELSSTNEEFKKFTAEIQASAKEMDAASTLLQTQRWKDALGPEQRALQHLLRAESMFRQIQVAFGQRGGGGGGGGGNQDRDLESLFDLELDTNKNQYETGDAAALSSSRERQVDESLKRLEELARRQQRLAEQQRRQNQQSFQQRWEQEMLRREAEQLRREMEEMASGQQSSSGQQSQQSQQAQQGRQSGQSSSEGQRSSPSQQQSSARSLSQMAEGGQPPDPRLNRALRQLENAIEDMRRAQQSRPSDAQRAAERMAEAERSLSGLRNQQTGSQLDDVANKAKELAARQAELEKQIQQSFAPRPDGQPNPGTDRGNAQLAESKDKLKQDYERFERELAAASRAMAGSQPQASSQLRGALGEAQQNEIRLRLQYGADLIRKGMGGYLAPRERVVSEMMRQLEERVARARDAASGQRGGEREQIESALNRLERARQALGRGEGQQGRQQQSGEQGRQAGAQARQGQGQSQNQGQQLGQGQQQGQNQGQGGRGQGTRSDSPSAERAGQPSRGGGGPSFSALNDGSLQGPMGGRAGDGRQPSPEEIERAYSESMRQLQTLRNEPAAAMEGTRAEIDALIEAMRRLDPKRFPGNPALLEALRLSVLPRMEQLELRLRLRLNDDSPFTRGASSSKVPPGYERATSEYYRRLSEGKKQ